MKPIPAKFYHFIGTSSLWLLVINIAFIHTLRQYPPAHYAVMAGEIACGLYALYAIAQDAYRSKHPTH